MKIPVMIIPKTDNKKRSTRTGSAAVIVAAACLAVVPATHREPAVSAETQPIARDAQPMSATARDQVDLAVTVYNSNVALVRDVRQLALPGGRFDLQFMDIAATVNPTTVHFRSLTDPKQVGVLEQNYQYDLLDPEKLLHKFVGREVTLVRRTTDNGDTREEEVKAQLIAYNQGPVWKIGNEIVTGMHADSMRFPEIPSNLHSRPTLVWTLRNDGSRQQRIEASYLAGQMSWTADYVLTVGRDDKAADLDGWVTVNNSSGTGFKDARLQLVAGDLHRVADEMRADMKMAQRAAAAPANESFFGREAFSEYHLYSLDRRTTIENNETKQISLLNGTGVPIEKRFIVDGQQFYYRNAMHPGSPLKDSVKVYYRFKNDSASGLGLPLPAGTIRVYQADTKGGVQFAGEDRIDHTAKDESINLQIGTAFDVVCERKQIDFAHVGPNLHEFEYEVTLRNHKPTPITVEVNEPIGGDWTMLRSTYEATKTEAFAARFVVPVAADGTSVLRYRIRARW